jgi:hypothetical protein
MSKRADYGFRQMLDECKVGYLLGRLTQEQYRGALDEIHDLMVQVS